MCVCVCLCFLAMSTARRAARAAAKSGGGSRHTAALAASTPVEEEEIPSLSETKEEAKSLSSSSSKRPRAPDDDDNRSAVSLPSQGWHGRTMGDMLSIGTRATNDMLNIGGHGGPDDQWDDEKVDNNRKRPRLSVGLFFSGGGGGDPPGGDPKSGLSGYTPRPGKNRLLAYRSGVPGTNDPPIQLANTGGGGGLSVSAGNINPDVGVSRVFPQLRPREWQQHHTVMTYGVNPKQMSLRDSTTEESRRMCPLGSEVDHLCLQNEMAFVVDEKIPTMINPNIYYPSTQITTSFNGLARGTRLRFAGVVNVTSKVDGYAASSLVVIKHGVVTIKNLGWSDIREGDWIAYDDKPFFARVSKGGDFGYDMLPRYREEGISPTKFRPVIFVWTFHHAITFKLTLTELVRNHLDKINPKNELNEKFKTLRDEVDTFLRGKQFPMDHPGQVVGYWIALAHLAEFASQRLLGTFANGGNAYEKLVESMRGLVAWVIDTEAYALNAPKEPASISGLKDSEIPTTNLGKTTQWTAICRYINDRLDLAYGGYENWAVSHVIGCAQTSAPIGGDPNILIGIKP